MIKAKIESELLTCTLDLHFKDFAANICYKH